MENKNKKTILIIAGIAVIGTGSVFFALRAPAAPSGETTSMPLEDSGATKGTVLFKVTPHNAETEFNIFEVLRGADKIVVGKTNEVAGEILLNMENPAKSEVGEFKVNARTLKTDDTKRDGAISRFILKSSEAENEFITFTPTALSGMPNMLALGTPFNFVLNGDLKVSGVVKPVTFSGNAILNSDGSVLTGSAETIVSREAFSLVIPNIPFVANVGDAVTLKIKFSATQ
ncbi:MAG: YceI family protein [bacterium]|nr:YceI family protein [bacterium]